MRTFNVYLGKKLIDIVFYDNTCNAEYVKSTLVNHDGYDCNIVVKEGTCAQLCYVSKITIYGVLQVT